MLLDKIDIQILDFLQKNAKLTAKEIGAKLNLTQTPVYERIKKLEKHGIISKYTVILNGDLLKKSLTVFINISLKEHQLSARNKFIEDISRLKYVMEFYNTSGKYDFLLKVKVNSINEYKDFLIGEISKLENIRDIESQIVLDEIKYSTALALDNL